MAKKRGAVRNGLEYLGLLFGCALLGWTPLFFAKAAAVLRADVWRFVDKRHRLRVIEQKAGSGAPVVAPSIQGHQ